MRQAACERTDSNALSLMFPEDEHILWRSVAGAWEVTAGWVGRIEVRQRTRLLGPAVPATLNPIRPGYQRKQGAIRRIL